MKNYLFILENGKPKVVDDPIIFTNWMISHFQETIIASDQIGDCFISTIFLGINHNYTGKDPPILFETMVFGGFLDEHCWRYSTWQDAKIGHKIIMERIKGNDPVMRG